VVTPDARTSAQSSNSRLYSGLHSCLLFYSSSSCWSGSPSPSPAQSWIQRTSRCLLKDSSRHIQARQVTEWKMLWSSEGESGWFDCPHARCVWRGDVQVTGSSWVISSAQGLILGYFITPPRTLVASQKVWLVGGATAYWVPLPADESVSHHVVLRGPVVVARAVHRYFVNC